MKGLLIDDDELFLQTLQRSLQRRGIECLTAAESSTALAMARANTLDFAIVDLKIGSESGMRLIEPLRAISGTTRIVIMTGYASVATAVEAVKAGAHDYLLKPVNIDSIIRAIKGEPGAAHGESDSMIPLGRLEWEHIQQALRETDGNVSAAARLLGVHRRSLQRKLAKRPAAGRATPPRED